MKSLRNMMGYERAADNSGVREADFMMCSHCQATVDVIPGKSVTDAGAFCTGCAGIICPRCAQIAAKTGICRPFEKHLDEEDRNMETLKRWGLA